MVSVPIITSTPTLTYSPIAPSTPAPTPAQAQPPITTFTITTFIITTFTITTSMPATTPPPPPSRKHRLQQGNPPTTTSIFNAITNVIKISISRQSLPLTPPLPSMSARSTPYYHVNASVDAV
ncbi:hypothetical protein BDQ12DRAFT_727613 [Crucibulum laeve]|uniref:Uncharacterized protein n=1 Tax=Crucibulum laeve TaxID=68775 RepID=A0A5C3LLK8_9AGAR|nr:hypothetical protein BDQ12DRAFT_727613 [Crucibulum laeve]